MPFAIGIKTSKAAGAPLWELWARFGQLEETSSMLALDYPPHVTLAVYEGVSADQLCNVLRSELGTFPAFRLKFTKLACFETPQLVFWAAPEASELLSRAHAAVHRRIDPTLCREHYRPDRWVPHCTLATNVTDASRARAIALTEQGIEPFDVIFDRADCVEFHPVRIVDECILQ
jgi:2'-5' RNA ligase